MQIFSGKWSDEFDRSKSVFEIDKDALETNNIVLFPGRFYILKYMSESKDVTNTRPVILSLGISQKDPDSFLCIDLCVIPKPIRIKFIEMYFNMFKQEIEPNIKKYWEVKDADKQEQIKQVTYQNLMKVKDFQILKLALKRYKIKNTKKIYSLLFNDVYKVIGNFSDENMFINGTIVDVQKEFIDKAKKLRL